MHYRDPISGPMSGLRQEIDQLFQDAFGAEGRGREGSGVSRSGRAVRGWTPAVEIREDEDELVFEFDLPGVRPDDVEVTSERGVLVVRGHRQAQRSEGPGRIHVTERAYGEFGRFFQLPQTVDEERIEAAFDGGVLTVRVPKAELARPRKIEIRSGGSAGGAGAGQERGARSAEVKGGSPRGAGGAGGPSSAPRRGGGGRSGGGGGEGGGGGAGQGSREPTGDDGR